MHLKQSINQWLSKSGVKSVTRLVPCCALVLCGIVLLLLAQIVSRYNFDERFEYMSSFLEVMIAANASCSFFLVGRYFVERRRKLIASGILGLESLEEAQMKDVIPYYNEFESSYERLAFLVKILGYFFASMLTILLVVGVKESMRPYAVVALLPIGCYFLSICVLGWFWGKMCQLSTSQQEVTGDPVDESQDLAEVLGVTGPIQNMEGE